METPTSTMIVILRERIDELRAAGNLNEALQSANATVEKCQQVLSSDVESVDAYVGALEVRAELFRETKQPEAACADCQQAIRLLEGRDECSAVLGRLHASLGAAYDSLQSVDEALAHWIKAIDYFEACTPPLLLDVVAISNNLAFLYKDRGDFDDAETRYLRALEILHDHVGRDKEETATVTSNLGALYLTAGYSDPAREMHMMALEIRRNLFGEYHPDTAQSHNNLALALLQTGDRSWARRHFEKALAGFEAMGEEYRDDLEAVAANYCSFLREEGESQMAELIACRVKEELAKTA